MALKRKISKEEFEKLPADIKTEYLADGEGFKLDLHGDDEGALQRALERERQNSKAATAELKQLKEQLDSLGDKAKDLTTLTAAHNSEKEALQNKINAYRQSDLSKQLEGTALALAQRLNKDSPKLVLPHIKERLRAAFKAEDSDDVELQILDSQGKPSKLTTDDLYKEFLDNKEFSAIVTGSKAQGGAGGNGQHKSGAFVPPNSETNQKPLSQYSAAEMVAHIAAKKESDQ